MSRPADSAFRRLFSHGEGWALCVRCALQEEAPRAGRLRCLACGRVLRFASEAIFVQCGACSTLNAAPQRPPARAAAPVFSADGAGGEAGDVPLEQRSAPTVPENAATGGTGSHSSGEAELPRSDSSREIPVGDRVRSDAAAAPFRYSTRRSLPWEASLSAAGRAKEESAEQR